uniref:Uncharacterized protein MANES_18G058100 n=1 Tax=Rhizophora mucronata TaxID=61149 RepID=A0A2P2MDJ9_RHIMU
MRRFAPCSHSCSSSTLAILLKCSY